jgi:hypothetical protein
MVMKARRILVADRRHNFEMPRVPFKDSNGATITRNRRKIPDRRLSNLRRDWLDRQ